MFKVLMVDDREIFLVELKRLKVWGQVSGFDIPDTAKNGSQALDLLRANRYDLVLTDVRMPGIDGLQLLREIRTDRLCPCVVILSEYSEFSYARQGIVSGAFDYLVKPVSKESLLELFNRAGSYLSSLKNGSAAQVDGVVGDKSEWVYPSAEENAIVNYFRNHDFKAVKLFRTTVDSICHVMTDNIVKADMIVKKLYHNIITSVYEDHGWLNYYINVHFFDEIDFSNEGDKDSLKEFYAGKIAWLLRFIMKYQPDISDEVVKNVCNYILGAPEGDLKLKAVADKFFINNTYLSNTFTMKMGIHFNEYVTMVKMARAEYLFKNTNLKTYEIGYQLGYRDTNYFSRQFKKFYGYSPKEYRNTD